jgi:hypothetical protein
MAVWDEWFDLVKNLIPGGPAEIGVDQIAKFEEKPEVPVVGVYVSPNYDLGNSGTTESSPGSYQQPQVTYINAAGLKSDINGNAIMNPDGTYTDKDGHTIMSDEHGYAIMPKDAPQYYVWYKPEKTVLEGVKDWANERYQYHLNTYLGPSITEGYLGLTAGPGIDQQAKAYEYAWGQTIKEACKAFNDAADQSTKLTWGALAGAGTALAWDYWISRTGKTNVDKGSSNAIIKGFSAKESAVINEAKTIVKAPEFAKIKEAHEAGKSVTININGRIIQYEPNLPSSGMTMFGENGFLIGREAFTAEGELQKTVLHELHRLATSNSAGGVSAELAAQETKAAADFAEKAFKEMIK